jgi:phosphate transport system permease protein
LDNGEALDRVDAFGEMRPTAVSPVGVDGLIAAGFADGTIRYGTVAFSTTFVGPETLPENLRALEPGEAASYDGGMIEKTLEGQFRLQRLRVELEEPIEVEAGTPVVALDASRLSRGTVVAAMTSSGRLHLREVTRKRNLLTNKSTVTARGGTLELNVRPGEAQPRWLRLAGLGDNVYLVWEDGRLQRYDVRSLSEPRFAESVWLAEEPHVNLTVLGFLIGKTSLVTGDSAGRVRVWFRTRQADVATPDGTTLTLAHEFDHGWGTGVSALASSARSRMIGVGYADGRIELRHVTSGRVISSIGASELGPAPVQALTLSPKDDFLLAETTDALSLWRVHAPHPEITLSAIFTPVWYEGAEAPAQVWQSSSGTDDFEPKYGLYPLIFGTLKATLYSMLFGVPVALLAAIYSSEMMHARTRARVKPVIEMMASLPSVVLGFLAALVVAPMIEDVVTQVLVCFATVPYAILVGAHVWQLLPRRFATRNEKYRIFMIGLSIVGGIWLAFIAGPLVERMFFAGNIKVWLDGQMGDGTGAWMFMLLPASCLAVAYLTVRVISPWMRARAGGQTHFRLALDQLIKFAGLAAVSLAVAYLVSYVLANGPFGLWELDPRGSFVDTYVQRNSLVVGFIMGFAIIPIIYTISEDALSAVPDHLRTASLGTGATPWQTATRIIIPTAASGLFSAVMIGFGRAVGETMIVLMAAGNTPVMDWNIFNGFRTLSANIAVELPEAVKDSTHYRMLFLAALCLFVITFVLNTIAESIRQRFRRRAFKV